MGNLAGYRPQLEKHARIFNCCLPVLFELHQPEQGIDSRFDSAAALTRG